MWPNCHPAGEGAACVLWVIGSPRRSHEAEAFTGMVPTEGPKCLRISSHFLSLFLFGLSFSLSFCHSHLDHFETSLVTFSLERRHKPDLGSFFPCGASERMEVIWIRECTQTEAHLKVHSDAPVWSHGCLCNLMTANSPLLHRAARTCVLSDDTQLQSWRILSSRYQPVFCFFWSICTFFHLLVSVGEAFTGTQEKTFSELVFG